LVAINYPIYDRRFFSNPDDSLFHIGNNQPEKLEDFISAIAEARPTVLAIKTTFQCKQGMSIRLLRMFIY